MKHCILKLYRSAKDGFGEWHDAVDAITAPGLVFWGRNDPYVTGEFGERLAKRTGARLLLFDDSGHWWPVTKPREVAGALESLWSSVG
jgi:pimeloyl-ACP methyl ester carboxylesterase